MQLTQNLQPALRTAFRIANSQYEDRQPGQLESIYYEDIIDELVSDEYWLGDIPGIRQWVTTRTYQEIAEYDRRLISKPWTTEGWRYNRVQRTGANIPQLTKKMGRTIDFCNRYPAQFCVNLLADGEKNTAYDKQPFFNGLIAAADGSVTGLTRDFPNMIEGTGVSSAALQNDLVRAMSAMAGFVTDTGIEIELEPTLIICPFDLYLDLVQLVTSPSSLKENQNSGVVNPIRSAFPTFRVQWSRKLKDSNDWYMIHDDIMQPTYWQTTRVEGQRIILDISDKTADEGWYGIAASIWGMGDYGFPWTAIKVKNS